MNMQQRQRTFYFDCFKQVLHYLFNWNQFLVINFLKLYNAITKNVTLSKNRKLISVNWKLWTWTYSNFSSKAGIALSILLKPATRFFYKHHFCNNAKLNLGKKSKQKPSNTLRLNFCHLKIIHFGTIHKVHTLKFGDCQTPPNVIKTIDVRFCLDSTSLLECMYFMDGSFLHRRYKSLLYNTRFVTRDH